MASTTSLVTFSLIPNVGQRHAINVGQMASTTSLGHIFIDVIGQHPQISLVLTYRRSTHPQHPGHISFITMSVITSTISLGHFIDNNVINGINILDHILLITMSVNGIHNTSLITFSLITMSVNGIHNILGHFHFYNNVGQWHPNSLITFSLITMSVNGIHNIIGHIFIDNNVGQWHPQHPWSHFH
ncbi:unnamed protein product [Acanthosepion pharaonis]|uniref:Uncharacterized protein n=1 Tax=Acanthosepion pharaonis TaxID=158019 RepID=A0A812C6C1_ACAPH|nr:unnamed protein product [Sepia pharaonis]